MMRLTFKTVRPALFIAVWLLAPLCAQAHEIGTSHVRFKLADDRTWSAEITTGPTALVNKLGTGARLAPNNDVTAEQMRMRLDPLRPVIANYIEVRFDGAVSPAQVDIARLEIPTDIAQPSYVVLRAHGAVPEHARNVTWRYGLIYSTYAVVFADPRGVNAVTQWLDGDAESKPFPVAANIDSPSRFEIAVQYLWLGFHHIVPEGLDHILFVLGIFLLTPRLKPILVQVTAFTVAHSVTLGLSMYGLLSLPPHIVEPLIALSIAYIAIENIVTTRLTPWRPVLVFGFGLIHGLGFAGALAELRLPHEDIVPALIRFNVGIELAQLAVIAVAYFAVAFWVGDRTWYRARVVTPVCVLIAAAGLFWTFQRILET